MKTRYGFVSNSSSSSFVCDLCGNSEGGYDVGLSDVDMGECVMGHTMCLDHFIDASEEKTFDDYRESSEFDYYGIPEEYCPICNLQALPDSTLVAFVSKTIIPESELVKKIKDRFGSYKQLSLFLRAGA